MKKKLFITNLLIGSALIGGAGLAAIMKPTQKIATSANKIHLEAMIPATFSNWAIDKRALSLLVDPEREASVKETYEQTLSRIYVNPNGQRIMLVMAYGSDQSSHLQVHKPEVCYAAQGFQIMDMTQSQLHTGYGDLPVKRLLAVQGERNEPITYWITVGDKPIKSGFDLKWYRLRYGVMGKIPDGMLVRVSSIDSDKEAAYTLQESFIHDLLTALNVKDRTRLTGAIGI